MKLMVLSNEVRIRRSVARLAIAMIPFLGFWASCGGKEGDSLFGAGGSVGASGSTTVASTTSTTTGSGDTSTSGTGGSIAGMGGSGGQGGTGSQRDAEMTGGADGSRDAGRTDAACISEEGGPCGGLLINPCQCADGLVCVFIGVPDAPGVCRRRDAGTDAGQRSCVAACDRCPRGPCCGNACCGLGEWCDRSSGFPICRCGNGSACLMPNTCQPIGFSTPNGCGDICCSTNCPQ